MYTLTQHVHIYKHKLHTVQYVHTHMPNTHMYKHVYSTYALDKVKIVHRNTGDDEQEEGVTGNTRNVTMSNRKCFCLS